MSKIKDFVSREAYKKLIEFNNLLLKWNKTINLVSSSTLSDIMTRHILDSLQLLPHIDPDDKIIDLGSGAGFPGVILSIAGVSDVTLIESDSRKAAFLMQAARLSSNKVNIINDRIEDIEGLSCDIITSRAFADLISVFDYSKEIQVNNKYLLHKGAGFESEIYNAKKHWLFNRTVHDSITSETGKVIEITNLKRK